MKITKKKPSKITHYTMYYSTHTPSHSHTSHTITLHTPSHFTHPHTSHTLTLHTPSHFTHPHTTHTLTLHTPSHFTHPHISHTLTLHTHSHRWWVQFGGCRQSLYSAVVCLWYVFVSVARSCLLHTTIGTLQRVCEASGSDNQVGVTVGVTVAMGVASQLTYYFNYRN